MNQSMIKDGPRRAVGLENLTKIKRAAHITQTGALRPGFAPRMD
jgi:hypothetical protein